MSKYIVDIDDFEPHFKVDSIGVFGIGKSLSYSEEDHSWSRIKSIEEFEELNSDYINEHFGELQDEAYRKGLEDGKTDNGYQDGVGDAWQTISLIRKMSQHTRETRFGANELGDIMGKYTAKELIAMMRPYFEKPVVPHSDRIEVGDEVEAAFGTAVVTYIEEGSVGYLYSTGSTGFDEPRNVKKTGKHYDIASILEAMRTHD